MRGDGFLAVAVPTVAPTAPAVTRDIQLQPTGSRHYVVTGTAVGNNVILPDATKCPLGAMLKIENASSEFIGLHLNGTAAYRNRIPPLCSVTVTLTAKATAAGTWAGAVIAPPDMAGFWSDTDHFLDSTAAARWTTVTNGAGALSAKSAAPNPASCFGNWSLRCGTTAAGYALIHSGDRSLAIYGVGPFATETYGIIDAVPTAAEDYVFQAGFGDDLTNGAHTDALVAEVARANGNTNWWLRACNNTAATTADSGIAMTTGLQNVRIERARGFNRADLWVDRVWGCTVAGLPSTTGRVSGRSIRMIGIAYAANTRTYQLSRWSETFVPADVNL
jgi:hypothetical protein